MEYDPLYRSCELARDCDEGFSPVQTEFVDFVPSLAASPLVPNLDWPVRLYHHRINCTMPALPPTVTVTLRNESRQELVLSTGDDNKALSPPSSSSSLLLTPTQGSALVLYLYTSGDDEKGEVEVVEVTISDKNVCLLEGTGSYRVFQTRKAKGVVELRVFDRVESASWMSGLRDDVLLSSLNLPGTHVGLLSSSSPELTCETLNYEA